MRWRLRAGVYQGVFLDQHPYEREAESGQIEKLSCEAILAKASAELLETSIGKMAFTSRFRARGPARLLC